MNIQIEWKIWKSKNPHSGRTECWCICNGGIDSASSLGKTKQNSSMDQILIMRTLRWALVWLEWTLLGKTIHDFPKVMLLVSYTVVSQTQIQWPNPPLNFISRTFFWSWWNQMRKRQPGWGEKSWEKPQCGYVLSLYHFLWWEVGILIFWYLMGKITMS